MQVLKHPSSLPRPGCTGVHRDAPQRHWCHPDTPGQNSVVTPSLVKRLFKPRHPSRLCGFHPIQLFSFITTPNFLPVVCWGAPQQGLWPPRYPLTPNTHPGYTGVHPISIGLHPGRMGCTPGDIWTPAGAVMKGVLIGGPDQLSLVLYLSTRRSTRSLKIV